MQRFQHEGFSGQVPGDPSSAAFLIAAAALTGSALTVTGVGLNPSRLHFLEVMARMGIVTRHAVERTEIGEPVGTIEVEPCAGVGAVRVEPDELPLVIDEVPVLAALAVHARADSWFLEAAELRVKESDRLACAHQVHPRPGGPGRRRGGRPRDRGRRARGRPDQRGGRPSDRHGDGGRGAGCAITLEDRRYGCRRGQLPGVRRGRWRGSVCGWRRHDGPCGHHRGRRCGRERQVDARPWARAGARGRLRQHGVDVSSAGGRVDPRGG